MELVCVVICGCQDVRHWVVSDIGFNNDRGVPVYIIVRDDEATFLCKVCFR